MSIRVWLPVLLISSLTSADQILVVDNDTLTTMKLTSPSSVQDVLPQVSQRGVHLDGGRRQGGLFGAAMAGNPFGDGWNNQAKLKGSMWLDTGTVALTAIDLALPSDGVRWIVGRSYNNIQDDGSHHDSSGYQGRNWFQLSQPEIMLYEGTTDDEDRLYVIYGADRFLEFERVSVSSSTFRGTNGAAGAVLFEAGATNEPDTYTFTDQRGTEYVFFGFDGDASPAAGQIWKIEDPAGNVAYVGDATTGSTAISSGFNGSGEITTAYDPANRRYSYTYTSGNLTEVKAEILTGGTWASPSGTETVGEVDYSYSSGNLEKVVVTTPLTDSGVNLERKQHYRYYSGAYNPGSNPGHPYAIKYIVDYEGYRKADWEESGAGEPSLDDGPVTMAEADLKPYTSAYFEYDGSRRIDEAYFNGDCGCGGGVNGTHYFSYETNGSYTDGAGYDTVWARRTIMQRPDGTYETQYFDEAGQPLSRVISDGDPGDMTADSEWTMQVVRNGAGQVTEIHSPANNDDTTDGYDHTTGTFANYGSTGLITVFGRVSSGDLKGLLEYERVQEGTGGSANYVSSPQLTSIELAVGDHTIVRPLVGNNRTYVAATTNPVDSAKYVQSTRVYSNTDLIVGEMTVKEPDVSSSNNGPSTVPTQKLERYFNDDGTLQFTQTVEDERIDFVEYTDGRVTKRITDADVTKTSMGEDFYGVTIPGDVANSGTPLHLVTEIKYDDQGRPDTTTLPSGRVTKAYYSKLGDGRMVTIRIPKYVSGTGTFHGPVQYTVSNHGGRAEASGTIAFSGGSTASALTNWIDESDDDLITAVDVGTLESLSVTIHSETGASVEETRSYFDIPTSGNGAEGDDYDATVVTYDVMGRTLTTRTAAGTYTGRIYDALGRVTQTWTGTTTGTFPTTKGNMVQTSSMVYDSGNDGGNSLITSRTVDEDGDWGTTTDQRATSYTYDYRSRLIIAENPMAPHVLRGYDFEGRQVSVAMYSSASGLAVGDDPTTETGNRLALSETAYDERGRVFETTRHEIDASDGASDDSLIHENWYDNANRLIKIDADQLAKFAYDRLGRRVRHYVLADDNDSSYTDMSGVVGDVVVKQTNTVYEDETDLVLMSAVIGRHHDDYGSGETTGALDSNADGIETTITAANVDGRVQITGMWYDDLGRLTTTVWYGTYGIVGDGTSGTNFVYGSASTSRDDKRLVIERSYDDAGRLKSVTDPRDLITQYAYDDLGRQVTVIANYVNGTPSGATGDDDLYTRYEYTEGFQTKMWVDIDGDGSVDGDDQVTLWIYGTTKGTGAGESDLASDDLLRAVVYPDSTNSATTPGDIDTDDSDVVSYAHNALGQEIWMQDQTGNVIETEFDLSGRVTARKATTIDTSTGDDIDVFDDTIKRIEMAFDNLGLVDTITQRIGTGPTDTVADQVKYTYDGWGNIIKFEQDLDSTVATGGDHLYDVDYTYSKATDGRNTIRKATMDLPDGTTVSYNYSTPLGSAGGDNQLSRVSRVTVGATPVTTYDYTGINDVVGIDYPEPDVFNLRFAVGASTGVYANMDRFNRVTDDLWTKDLATDVAFYDVDISYDRNSNITDTTDNIHLSSGGNRTFDVLYTIDDLDRLTKADEGTLSGGSISNRTHQEVWTLDQAGNWDLFRMDLNGDVDFSDAGELDDDRTHNVVNELAGRDTDDNGSDDHTLVYDKVGNLTDDNKDYKYKYDVWGRLIEVRDQSDSLITTYGYNGLDHRVHWHYDVDADGTLESTSDDPDYFFVYDIDWRIVATFRELDSDPKEQFVYHNAGLGGWGGGQGFDTVILRDRDNSNGWEGSADGTLEERNYYCQNWRDDVSVIIDDGGRMVEWVKYSSYGTPYGLPACDTDADGDCDTTDLNQINTWISAGYDVRGDIDLDGDVDLTDLTSASSGPSGETLGRMALSRSDSLNRKGYAGYENDSVLQALYHVRHRLLHCGLGRLTQRDPIGYEGDPKSLYQYVMSNPVVYADPLGLMGGLVIEAFPGEFPCGYEVVPNGEQKCQVTPKRPLWNICFAGEDIDECARCCDKLAENEDDRSLCLTGCKIEWGQPTMELLPEWADGCHEECKWLKEQCEDSANDAYERCVDETPVGPCIKGCNCGGRTKFWCWTRCFACRRLLNPCNYWLGLMLLECETDYLFCEAACDLNLR